MKKGIIVLGIFLFLNSCKDFTVQPGETPYDIWKEKNIHDYSIDQVRICFCPHGGDTIRIAVKADTIYSIRNLSGDMLDSQYDYYYTIDSLFGIIQYGGFDSLDIEYNSEFGYPEYLDIDPQLHPVDGGVLYKTFNLVRSEEKSKKASSSSRASSRARAPKGSFGQE